MNAPPKRRTRFRLPAGVVTAKPNGNGTGRDGAIPANGTWTWPTVSCAGS